MQILGCKLLSEVYEFCEEFSDRILIEYFILQKKNGSLLKDKGIDHYFK